MGRSSTSSPTSTPPARAWPGTSRTRGCSAAVARFYGTAYRNSLLTEWLPAVDGLIERLTAGIRVLDVGCGLGVPTIMLAEAFPNSTFVGVGLPRGVDPARPRPLPRRPGSATASTSRSPTRRRTPASYDLVLFFDAVHDFGDPVGALAHARGVLAPGGRVVAVEPFAEDTLEANLANPIAAVFYVGSSALCVPHSVSEGGAALGAQAGPTRLTARVPGCRVRDGRGRCSHARPTW